VDTQRSAELQVLLEGVPLPASRAELIDYAVAQEEGALFRGDLESLPDRQYETLDEVGEELIRVQPARSSARAALPREESGEPPGGDAYTDPAPEPGLVREDWPANHPPSKVIEQPSETQKTQQRRQEAGG
jgi:hypothetical protein